MAQAKSISVNYLFCGQNCVPILAEQPKIAACSGGKQHGNLLGDLASKLLISAAACLLIQQESEQCQLNIG